MENKEHKHLEVHTIILSVIILVLLGIVAMVSTSLDYAVKYEVRKVNRTWIEELDNRGLIIKNDNGGFRWREKKAMYSLR